MDYNYEGLRYFINITSLSKNNKYLPEDIRRLIWYYAHDYLSIDCYLCHNIIVKLKINIFKNINNENFSTINGVTACNNCINNEIN